MFRSRFALDLIDLQDALVGAAAVAWLLGFVVAVEVRAREARLLARDRPGHGRRGRELRVQRSWTFGGHRHARTDDTTSRHPRPDRPRRRVHGRAGGVGPLARGLERPGRRGRGHPAIHRRTPLFGRGVLPGRRSEYSNAARRAEADSRLGGSAAPIRLKHKPAWAAASFPLVDLHADYQWRCFMPTISDGFTVLGAIEEKWLSIGGPTGHFGHPVSQEIATFDGVGRFRKFPR